jgi:hypothetical protein
LRVIMALGKFDEARRIGDLAAGLGQRLALLHGHHDGQVFLVFHHQVEPFPQDDGAFLGRLGAPCRHRLVGRLDGAARLGGAHFRDGAQGLARRGIAHIDGFAAVGIAPGAVDVALLAE